MADLTVYLLRDEVQQAADAIEGPCKSHIVEDGGVVLGTLFCRPRQAKPPKWSKLFHGFVDSAHLGKVQSTGALYVVQTSGRQFALAFGQGRYLLRAGITEERFGLLVVLNSGAKDFRSVDKRSFDTVDQNSRVQTSQNSAPAEFGIDIEKDLIRAVTASPADVGLGRRMTGSDSLTVAVDVALKDLPALLSKYLTLFQSKDYKANFDWVDNIMQISSTSPLYDELNSKLVERVHHARTNDGHAPGCWMAIPDLVDWNRVSRFRYGGGTKSATHSDIHFRGFLSSLSVHDATSVELLKRRSVCAIDDNGDPVDEKWPIYRCIHCEVDLNGSTYVLSGGNWFNVRQDFVQVVDDYFASIPLYLGAFIEYQHDGEGAYNNALCASDPVRFALMDQKNIQVGGIHDKVEFCDAYTVERHIIHIKRYGGSSLLGHLFNQGLVSGSLLRDEEDFAGLINKKLPQTHKLTDDGHLPREVAGYSIVFAIISEAAGPLKVPFFARVALRHARRLLINLNYGAVQLAKIQVNELFAKTQVQPPKKHKGSA